MVRILGQYHGEEEGIWQNISIERGGRRDILRYNTNEYQEIMRYNTNEYREIMDMIVPEGEN